jgi:hypothetical protein
VPKIGLLVKINHIPHKSTLILEVPMAGTQFFGERIKRNEDHCLLTGQALFTDDVSLSEILYSIPGK